MSIEQRNAELFQMTENARLNLSDAARYTEQSLYDNPLSLSGKDDALNRAFDRLNTPSEAWAQDTDTLTGAATNLAASVVSGASRTLGSIGSSGASVEGATLASIPQEYLDAYNVLQDPNTDVMQKAAAQEMLNQRVKQDAQAPSFGASSAVFAMDETTYGQRIGKALEAQKQAKEITDVMDISGIVNQENKDALDAELTTNFTEFQEAWDRDDTSGVIETAKLIGKSLKTAITNPQAIAEYTAENIPSILTGASKVLSAADNTGYALGIFNERIEKFQKENDGQLPTENQLEKELAFAASAGLAEKVGDASLLKSLTQPKGVVKGLLATAAKEGTTEAYQAAVEGGLAEGEVDAEGIYKSAVIGAASGTALSGAGEAVGAVSKGTTAIGETIAKATGADKKAAIQQAKEEVIASGDPQQAVELIKAVREGNKTPSQAIDTATEIATSETTPIEAKQAASEEVNRQITEESSKVDDISNQMISAFESGDTSKAMKLQKDLDNQMKVVEQLKVKATTVSEASTLSPEDITLELDKVSDGDIQAAQRVYSSFKANNASVTDSQLQKLVESTVLPEAETKQIEAVLEVRKLMNTLEGTESEVLTGGYNKEYKRNMLGLKDYQDMILQGDRDKGLKGLSTFAKRHTTKAEQYEQALEESKFSGQQVTLEDGTYVNAKAPKSVAMVAQVRKEADLLTNAYKAFEKAPAVVPTFG